MADFFNSVLNAPGNLSKQFLGQNYKYQEHIKSPQELNMSSEGSFSAIGNNIGGLISYVELLVAGGGNATKDADGPLGDRFFLKTGGQCTDIQSGKKVDRYIYIDNVPDGTLPFISASMGDQKFDSLKGLVPGILTNVAHIEPTKIFGAFMMGAEPLCMEVKKNVINEKGTSSESSHHLIRPDIASGGKVFKADLDKMDAFIKKIDDDTKIREAQIEANKKERKAQIEANKKKEAFSSMTNKGNANRGKAKRPYAARRPYGTTLPYGPDRPYYSSQQSAYKSLYLEERPYIYMERPPLPEYVMPVAIVPDFKLDEKEVEEREEDIRYAPDITHKKDVATVPQIKEVVIKNIEQDATAKKDYSKMPDDTFLKIYYSSLGLLGLYMFLKLVERKG